MATKELKIPVSCRVNPDLKYELEAEAQDEGLTTSKYIERLLQDRHESSAPHEKVIEIQEDEEMNEMVAEMSEEIFALKRAKRELTEEVESLNKQIEVFEDVPPLPAMFDFSEDELEAIEEHLNNLRGQYSDQADKDLILASLQTQVKNEKATFFIHTLKAYFEKQEAQNLVT